MSFISIDSPWIRAVFCALGILISTPLSAQITQVGSLEFPLLEGQADRYISTGLGEHGLMLYRRIRDKTGDQLELMKIDTALHENWRGLIPVSRNLNLLRVKNGRESLFLLLKDWSVLGGDFQILSVKMENGDFVKYNLRNLIPFNPTEFLITDQAAFIGGYFNYRPIILYFSFATQRSKVLPGFFNEPGEIDQIRTYDDGSVDVVVSAKNVEKRKSLWIRNYDANGDLIKTTMIEPEEKRHLIFGRSAKLEDGQQIVSGVYGRFPEYSRGIFVATINPVGEYTIAYYNFAQFKNFFSYLRSGRQKRIKERIERRTVRGKKIKFNYRFLIHDLIPYKNQYIMTGEAFYPHYIYPNNYYSYGYRPGTNGMILDGYQFTHAVVIGFDKNGKIRWDNSFEINDVKTMRLEPFVKVLPDQERIVMMYMFEDAFRAKIIDGDKVIEGKSQDVIHSEGTNYAELKQVESGQFDYWYGGYFYASGVQRLKLKSGYEQRVYFINKITYKTEPGQIAK